ncbi:unnamed protein product [Dibothriocephalus latus]|uniref:Pre-rRNA-processing protein TSR1 homolog n=1 Tax=Dibothriocephalus latus TaxID=60516 RepID=A0A3P7NQF1_DIBLA|nr:unnamed protein product [Dibothriocephalus latus]
MDLARLADWIIFVLPGDIRKVDPSSYTELLSALYAQGLPSSVFCVMSNISDTRELLAQLQMKFTVNEGKIRVLNSTADAFSLLRYLALSQKKPAFCIADNCLASKDALKVGITSTRLRCGMLVEDISTEPYEDNEDEEMPVHEDAAEIPSESEDAGSDDLDFEESETASKKTCSFGKPDIVHKIPSSALTTEAERAKAAYIEHQFPDEVEVPPDVAARTRFAKYRGLPSFNKCTWPTKDDPSLPYEYGKIFRFANYPHNRRTIVKYTLAQLRQLATGEAVDPLGSPLRIPSGSLATLTIGPMDRQMASTLLSAHTQSAEAGRQAQPLVVWSLLPYERCLSVLHLVLQKRANELAPEASPNPKGNNAFDPDPIMAKEPTLFQPIWDHNNCWLLSNSY